MRKEYIMYCLEYSPKQKSFHIDKIDRITQININMLMNGQTPEYFIISGPKPFDEIIKFSKMLEAENPNFFKQFKMEEFLEEETQKNCEEEQ